MNSSIKKPQPIGNRLTSWKEAYRVFADADEIEVSCLYEDVSPGTGATIEEAKDDFLENIRMKMSELADMLEYCAKSQPRLAPKSWCSGTWTEKELAE